MLLSIPDVRQATDYTCGPSALQAVLADWGIEAQESELATAANATPAMGASRFALAKVARSHGLKATITTGFGLPALEVHLRRGIPVIVSIRAWRDKPTTNWATDWDDGHHIVVVGYDKDRIYVEDPSIL
ncbi:MAG: C39 family peptidase [Candidatus Sericytochromatia bacterium]|nr:C39 family peptidase [Candidatus Sericytochromatia bacterium]